MDTTLKGGVMLTGIEDDFNLENLYIFNVQMYPHLTKYDMWCQQERKITWRYITLLFDQTLRILILSFMTETNLFLLANGKLDVYNKFEGLKHLGSLKNWQKMRIWSWL